MTRFLLTIVSFAAFVGAAHAGTITGKVSGRAADSVVYVDAIPAKTIPGSAKHPVMDQKNLSFQPHILVVQQGTTVDFLNSDSVSHNVPRHLAARADAFLQIRQSRNRTGAMQRTS